MHRLLVLVFVLAEINFTCAPSSACADDEDDCVEPSDETGETGSETGETGETEGTDLPTPDLG